MRSPREYNLALLDKVKNAFDTSHQVIQGSRNSVHISNVSFDPLPDEDDYASHKETLRNNGTHGINMYADVDLKHNATGNVLDSRKKVSIGFVPLATNRFSHIVGGKEYIVHNQFRVRPAIYTKMNRLGESIADFNLSKGKNLSIYYQPAKEQMMVKAGSNNVPLYTYMKDVYKVPDKQLINSFGPDRHIREMELYQPNRDTHVKKLHNVYYPDHPVEGVSLSTLGDNIKAKLDLTGMDAETNMKTLGVGYDKVNPDSMLHAAREVMSVYKGEKAPTWKDNIAFKSVHSTEDFMHERLTKPVPVRELHARVKPKIDRALKVSDTGVGPLFKKHMLGFFKDSNLVNYPQQVNPMEFLENAHKITSLGEGGVEDTNSLPIDARNLHISQMGFVDPVRTPDDMKAGIDLRLTLPTWKKGDKLYTLAHDKDGKKVEISHTDLYNHPYTIETEREQPSGMTRAYHKGKMVEMPRSDIKYTLPSHSMFTVTSAAIPFIANCQGQRVAMGAKMTTQALSLVNREAPLVDTEANSIMEGFYNPKAKADGEIHDITKDKIIIKDSTGKLHDHHIPHNMPLNYHSYMHVDANVKKGDKVKKGQLLGDNIFSKDGKMALGVNAHVAFMPTHGFNYEDGFVMSESGANKFASNHMFVEQLDLTNESIEHDHAKFKAFFPAKYNKAHYDQMDGAVVKIGTKVHSGDPLMLALKKRNQSPEVMRLGKMASRLSNPYSDASVVWHKDYPGEVVDVIKKDGFTKVVVKAVSPLVVGDKIAGRFGNKGVITKIIPDHEAPKLKDGSIPDVYMNPAGIPSRMNLGQIYETALGKVAHEKGLGSIKYPNFNKANTFDQIKNVMKQHGVKDTEDLIDPQTGRVIPNVFTGRQHVMKLFKQTEVNFSARAGGEYDIDMRPVRGGEDGAKSLGVLDFYGMAAHNSRNMLQEAATVKAEYNPEAWKNILSGQPLPAPKSTFAFDKTLTMLKGMGVNVQKEGNSLKASPFMDKDILALSKGEIKEPTMVTNKTDPATGLNFRPEKDGLFDPVTTGGLVGGDWSHIKLNTPVVNHMFHKPIRALLKLKQKDFDAISNGEQHIDVKGKMLTGGHAIKEMLSGINVKEDLKKVREDLEVTTSVMKRDPLLKKMKYLSALDKNNLHPVDAYVLHHLPVIPPKFRPIYPKETGEPVTSDANYHYRDIIHLNNELGSPLTQALGTQSDRHKKIHSALTESIRKMQGIDGKTTEVKDREPAGFLDIIKGRSQPKYGYFQGKLMSRAQDLVGRGTVAPDPGLGMDQVGMPEPMAWTLYSPFVIGNLVRSGYDLPKAQKEVQSRSMAARNLLQAEMKKRPCVINRAPTLHKFSMVGQEPVLTQGKTVKISPLIVKGMGMDFDGDTIYSSVFQRFKKGEIQSFFCYNIDSDNVKGEINMPTTKPILAKTGLTNLKDFPRIEESKETKGNVDWYKVPEGVEVLVLDNNREYKWMYPEFFTIHRDLTMVNVQTHAKRTVLISNDHSLITLDQDLNIIKSKAFLDLLVPVKTSPVYEYSLDKISLKDLGLGEGRKHDYKENMELNYDTGYLFGCIAGDGWVSSISSNSGALCFASITREMDQKWKDIIQKEIVDSGEVHLSIVNADHTFDGYECRSDKVTWYSAGSFALLVKDLVGHGAANKHLPPWFLQTPITFRKGLLAGLIDTDGSVSLNDSGKRKDQAQTNINFTSTSSTLAFDVVALGNSLGLVAGVTPTTTPKGAPCWAVYFNAESILKIKRTIKLYHPEKAEKLSRAREDVLINREKYGPPLTKERIDELRKMIGSPRLYKKGTKILITEDPIKLELIKQKRSIYGALSDMYTEKNGRKPILTQTNVEQVLAFNLPEMDADPFWVRWKEWATDKETEWERIESIEPVPHITEAYDLTIPPAYTMVTESGIVVWDTTTIHIPISDKAIKEVHAMKPSNNLFNPLDKRPMHVPDMETMMGLHLMTTPKQANPIKTFKTSAEARQAYHRKEIDVNDHIEVQEINK